MGEVGLYSLYVCHPPAQKTRSLNWLRVISLFPTVGIAFQSPDAFDYHDEVQLSHEPNVFMWFL